MWETVAENRTTERFPVEEEVTFLSPREIIGRSVDIGAGGIGVEIPEPLEAGEAVELKILEGHAIVYGTVRWARPQDGKFRVGIQFREEDWNVIELVFSLRSQEG